MNSAALARSAYRKSTAIAPTDRAVEYRAFARITGQLAAAANETGPGAFPRLCDAIRRNRRLWAVLARDVASDDNALPDELRAGILSLADFTWKHSGRVLGGEADAEALIEINSAVMRGLRNAAETE